MTNGEWGGGWGGKTCERDHVHHRGVACDQEQEGDLHGVGMLDVAGLQLLDGKPADEVVLGLLRALVDQLCEVVEEFPDGFSAYVSQLGDMGRADWLAACACRAVPLPFDRIAFCCVRYSRSSNGTPRMV